MINLYDEFIHKKDSFGREFPTHTKGVIRTYYGVTDEGNFRISFWSSKSSKIDKGTEYIKIVSGHDEEEGYVTCFDLINSAFLQPFCLVGSDLLMSVDGEDDEDLALTKLKNRFTNWIKMLKKENKGISHEDLKGLFGELYYMKNNVISEFGYLKAVTGWGGGPTSLSKDFSIDDYWIEIKTTSAISESIKISSINQLQSDNVGRLVVIKAEEMTEASEALSVTGLGTDILSLIPDDDIKDIFLEKLCSRGFMLLQEKEEVKFDVRGINAYRVDKNFPSLKLTEEQAKSVSNVRYDLVLATLDDFLEK